jgi:phosphonate transport system substrate-binding protein
MRKLKFYIGISLLVIMMLIGCHTRNTEYFIDFQKPGLLPAPHTETTATQRPLLIALATVLSPQETIAQYRQIADYVARKTGRPTVLIQRKTYEEINLILANSDVDIAFMSTGAYSSYRGMNEIELLVMTEYAGSTLYNAEVIVHRDSDFQSIEELQDKAFAFTDPLSYSGHMVIEEYLRKRKALPETFFKRYFFTYSHDKSLWAVANKVADGASLDSQILEYAKVRTPEVFEKVRIIATIGPAPTGPIAIKKNMSAEQKAQLREVFLNMHTDPATAGAMKKLIIDRFVIPTPQLYEPLQKLYDRTSLAI